MTLRERIDALGGDYEDQPPWEREIDALRAELERQKAHNKLQQSTLHELHARMKTKDAENERLRSELSEAYERAAKVCEEADSDNAWWFADRIRALKDKP